MTNYRDDCPGYLADFLFYLKVVKARSERTVEAYYIDIRTFLRYLRLINRAVAQDTQLSEIKISDTPISYIKDFTLNNAYEYLYYTSDELENTTTTRARKTSALKQFFNFLHKKAGLIQANPLVDLEIPAVKNKLPKFLTLEESLELLKSINSTYPERDYCIITLFLNCGMRLSELVGLNIKDISFENSTMRLLGKGNKERIIYINFACVESLRAYLAIRPNAPKEQNAVFLSKRYLRISKRRVQQIVENCLFSAGLDNKGISTHKLRHTAATLMYQHGNVDPLVLKEILGHKSIATTEIYTHLSSENLKKAAESSPLSNVKKLTKGSRRNKPSDDDNSD
ncbi:MAG: tyrosine-type recombinase/integrase [Oscillospiraceae bacterium]|jgi:site-specific recombinase XerD